MPKNADHTSKALDLTKKWEDRDKREELRELAKQIVADHLDEFEAEFGDIGDDHIKLVQFTEAARERGDDGAEARANAWALGRMPQQRIVGGNG